MNLMELFVKIGVDDQASSKVSSVSKKLGNGLKTAAKIGTAAVAAASTAVVGLATSAIKSYAEYEQLVGGVETLFKENASVVQGYAEQAYKTANMSANKYMEMVTSFSASLLQGLGGDTAKAAEYADMAVRDMSDNANKFGTDISMIQNAYQGFAKRNYTMLDNLKLGYGGTASEMARLINDSGVLGDTVTVTASNINRVSFDKIVEAINVVQTQMGITGTTAKEASTTIQGSINTMKGAWENLKIAMVSDTGDIDQRINEFVDSVGTVGENLLPRVKTVLKGVTSLVTELGPDIIKALPDVIQEGGPEMTNAAKTLVGSIGNLILDNGGELAKSASGLAGDLLTEFSLSMSREENQEKVQTFIGDIISAVTDEKFQSGLHGAGVTIVDTILGAFTSKETSKSIWDGIANFFAQTYFTANDLAIMFEDFLLNTFEASPEGYLKLKSSGDTVENWQDFLEHFVEWYDRNYEARYDAAEDEAFNESLGIQNPIPDEAIDAGKNFNGGATKNPSQEEIAAAIARRERELGRPLTQAEIKEIIDRMFGVNGSHKRGLSFVPFDGYIAELHKGERVLTAKEAKKYNRGVEGAQINITINGAQYNSEESIAEAVAYKIQQMINGREAAYA